MRARATPAQLYLVNQAKVGVRADVMLYDMSGAMLTTKHLYLAANTQQSASIRQILSDGSFLSEAGSVEVLTPTQSGAVLGQLSITRIGTNKAYLDEELFMPHTNGSQTLRSVIDSPENSPIVAVTNISTTIGQTLNVSCIPSAGAKVEKTVILQPKQTSLIRACSTIADTVFSPDAMDSQFILKPETQAGLAGERVAGINITTDGPPGELAAFGFVAHSDDFGSYFSAMNFSDLKQLHSPGFAFTGVPVGPSRLISQPPYTPQVAVTNFSATPQMVTVLLATTEDQATALNSVQSSSMHQVAAFSVPAGASKLVNLPGLGGSPDWQNSFIVRSSGQPGDVIAKMMFKGKGSLPNIELIGKDEHDTHTAGDHPWTTENGTTSTLFLFNHSSAVKTASVRIGASNTVWLKLYDLKPNETKAIRIGDLVASGAPDMNGVALAKTLTSGEVGWWVPSDNSPEVTGRVVQVDSAGTMARNFSCGDYIGMCQVAFTDDPVTVSVGSSMNETTNITFSVYCNGPITGCPACQMPTSQAQNRQATYTSSNSSIAQVTGNAGYSTWTGMAPGMIQGSMSITTYSQQDALTSNTCTGEGPVGSASLSQSPEFISQSNGDMSPQISVAVNPVSFAPQEAISVGLLSNPNSSSAAFLATVPPAQFNGTNDIWTLPVSGSNSPSGIFSATACADLACSNSTTIITIPPQVILQMMYAEANGTGNQTAMASLGETIGNRFTSSYFNGSGYNTWQNSLVSGQVAINAAITTGVQPELNAALTVFTGANGGWCGALAFWSPTASQWAVVQNAISSKTATFPASTGAPTYNAFPSSIQQILYDPAVGNAGSGAPNFLYLAPRESTAPAAVQATCI